MAFLSERELAAIGFARVGRAVRVSDKVSIHGAGAISLGDHARIDDFCVLSASGGGSIEIGRYVHVSPHAILLGGGTIVLEDFAQLSSRATLLSASDDIHGEYPIGAAIPEEFRCIHRGRIVLRRYSGVAAGSTVLPDVEIGEGTIVGAMSLVRGDCEPYSLYVGVPARRIKARGRGFLRRIEALLEREKEDADR
ncbi:MAG TPA: acyltransferase [Myxococcota bacterium]|nr:acyltransferase [Myxococcota bacterium]